MTQKDIATVALLFVTLLVSIVAIGSPGWIRSPSGTTGLFEECKTQEGCSVPVKKMMSTSDIMTTVFLISSVFGQIISIGCFTTSLVWTKNILPFVGFAAASMAAFFLATSCIIYTSMNYNTLSSEASFGYTFMIAWIDCGICSFTASLSYLAYSKGVVTRQHDDKKVIVFKRAGLVFMFNFYPTKSYPNYRIGVRTSGTYKIVLDSDQKMFGGHGRNEASVDFHTQQQSCDNNPCSLMVYLPSRCVIVMASDALSHWSNDENANRVYYGYDDCCDRGRDYNSRSTSPWRRERSHIRGRSPSCETRLREMNLGESRRDKSPYRCASFGRSQPVYNASGCSSHRFQQNGRSPSRSRSVGFSGVSGRRASGY